MAAVTSCHAAVGVITCDMTSCHVVGLAKVLAGLATMAAGVTSVAAEAASIIAVVEMAAARTSSRTVFFRRKSRRGRPG